MTDKKYFCGSEISQYGIKNGYVDYRALAKSFDAVYNWEIMQVFPEYWEQVNGFIDNSDEIEQKENKIDKLQAVKEFLENRKENSSEKYIDIIEKLIDKADDEQNEIQNDIDNLKREEEDFPEIFQYFIISDSGANILQEYTNEIVYYNEKLDMYVWEVTHYGTAWDYVLTNIKIDW